VCDIGFKLKVHLKKHNLYRHSEEYPCECSICGKRFKVCSFGSVQLAKLALLGSAETIGLPKEVAISVASELWGQGGTLYP